MKAILSKVTGQLLFISEQQIDKLKTPLKMASSVVAETPGTFIELDHGLIARKTNFNNHDGSEYLNCLMNSDSLINLRINVTCQQQFVSYWQRIYCTAFCIPCTVNFILHCICYLSLECKLNRNDISFNINSQSYIIWVRKTITTTRTTEVLMGLIKLFGCLEHCRSLVTEWKAISN